MANDIDKTSPHYKGDFGSIYEVNKKFPTGGVAGDFVVIEGWAHYWNADRATWCVNAERDSYWDELITNIIEKFKLIRGATYMGVASLDTVPAKVIGAKMYYFATVAGTYKNFGDLVVPQGINVLYSENGSSWVNTTLLEVDQELGVSTRNVVSQKVVNDALNLKANQSSVNEALAKKADKEEMNRLLTLKANTTDVDTELAKKFNSENIAQESGNAEDKVMSQKAVSTRLSDLEFEMIHFSSPLNGMIPKEKYTNGVRLLGISLVRIEYDNVIDLIKLNQAYITYARFSDDYDGVSGSSTRISVEIMYDNKYYYFTNTRFSTTSEKKLTGNFDDGTTISLALLYPAEALGQDILVDVRNYKIGFKESSTAKEISKIEGNKVAEPLFKGVEIVKNVFGYCNRQFSHNPETPIRQDITYNDEYYNIKLSRVAETLYIGVWNAFDNFPIIKGHKYIIITKYRINSYGIQSLGGVVRMTYYLSSSNFRTPVYLRFVDSSDCGHWKYALSEGIEFTALTDGAIMDVVFNLTYGKSFTTETLDFDIDIIPIVLDVTYTNLRDGAFIEYFEKFGVIYDSLTISKASIISLNSTKPINMVALGDSTTGMMMWQDKLARLKGWNWNMETNGGYEVDGQVRAAMGVGSTWVEPIITNTTGGMKGQSHYMRAKDAKYYNPDILFVMSSYNGTGPGRHWADNDSYPIQPEDCGINDEPYKGEEVDLTQNPSAVVPSFGASYYGMIEQLVTDLPNTQIVLLNLTSDFAGASENTFAKKNAVIKKAAEKYNLLMLDVEKEAGFNKFNRLVLRYDGGGVHFNEAGGMRLAMYIASKISL